MDSGLETLQARQVCHVNDLRGNPGNEKRVVFRGNPGNGELVRWSGVGLANCRLRLSQNWNKFDTIAGVHICAPAKKNFAPTAPNLPFPAGILAIWFEANIFLLTVLFRQSVPRRLNLKWFSFTNTTISNTWT